jgi:hypothetical protein
VAAFDVVNRTAALNVKVKATSQTLPAIAADLQIALSWNEGCNEVVVHVSGPCAISLPGQSGGTALTLNLDLERVVRLSDLVRPLVAPTEGADRVRQGRRASRATQRARRSRELALA